MSPYSSKAGRDCPEASNPHEWLSCLNHEPPDTGWLSRNEDVLFAGVQRGLSQTFYFHDAVELLMLVFPYYALVQMHTRRWWPLLFDALADAHNLRDSAMLVQILTRLGESYIVFGKHAEAKNAFSRAIERAHEKQIAEMLLAAYIGIIKVEITQMSDGFDDAIVQHALQLANQVNDLTLKASLEQTLAMVYVYRKETALALGHGQTAYALWQKLQNHLEMGRTAIILSQAYRISAQYDRSVHFLETAQEHFVKTDLARQEAVTAYEKGCLYLEQGQPSFAQEWFELALQEFKVVGMDHQIAGAAHALALAQIERNDIVNARTNLQAALHTWQDLKYWHEQANALYALGYLDFKTEQWDKARESWKQALHLCNKVPEAAFRSALEAQIIGALQELDDFRPDSRSQAGTD